jgi:dCTP deaminase
MILSNVEIHRALDVGDIVIKPEPTPRSPSLSDASACPYQTTAVDMRLASDISIPDLQAPFTFDLRKGGLAPFLSRISRDVSIPPSGYVLDRNQFILGRTEEWISLPIKSDRPSIAARVEGKSSRARCGMLVHFTAPTIHAGFEGTITLEIINLGPYPITLFPGVPICQLIFERVDGTPTEAPSQFQGQTRPVGNPR